jgi:3-phenylpropionate/cinnamic acid dioxygenase small subunit
MGEQIMERTEIGIGNMRIDVVDDNAVYINLNGYTYYIDDSTNEQIFKKYIEDNDQIIEKHK